METNIDIIKEAASLLGRLNRKDEIQREHNLHDKMLLICARFLEQPVDSAGYDAVNAHLIQQINDLFSEGNSRRQHAPTIARKIIEHALMRDLKMVLSP